MPVLVDPTFTELQIRSVQAKALGIERISNSSLRVMPFETIAEYPPIKFTPNSSATRSNVCAIFT